MADLDPRRLPFGRRPTVHVCMRDEPDAPEDRLYAVRITDSKGDVVISLQADDLDEGIAADLQRESGGAERVWLCLSAHAVFELRGFRRYVGNILWDAGTCTRREAIALVEGLLLRGFHMDEVVEVQRG